MTSRLPLLLASTALTFSASASAELTREALVDLVRAEDAVSGSLLPFPVRGDAGVVGDDLSVTYNRLQMMGLPLADVTLTFGERGDGLYDVTLTGGGLDPRAFGPETDVSFEGVWNPEAATYESYTLSSDLAAFGADGSLSLEANAGVDGGMRLEVDGYESRGMALDTAVVALSGVDGQIIDPYGLTNGINSLGEGLTFDNPFALLGLLNAYSDEIFGSNADILIELAGGSLDDGRGEVGALESLSVLLEKRGEGPNGQQSLNLSQAVTGVSLVGPNGGFRLSEGSSSQSLSFNDLMGLVPQMLPLGLQASGIDTPGSAAPLVRSIGQMIATLDPKLMSEVRLTDLEILEDQDPSAYQDVVSGGATSTSYSFVFDLTDEIAFHTAIEDGEFINTNRWSDTNLSLAAGQAEVGLTLWDTFVTDIAHSIADGLSAFDGMMEGDAGAAARADTLKAAETLTKLLGGLFTRGEIDEFASFDASEYYRTATQYDTLNWNFGTEQVPGSAKLDWDLSAKNAISIEEWDTDYNREEKFPLFTAADVTAARDGAAPELVTFLADSFDLDTNVIFGALAPFVEELEVVMSQADALQDGDPDAVANAAERLTLAGLNLFQGGDMRLSLKQFMTPPVQGDYDWDSQPGVSIGAAEIEVLFNELFGYRGFIEDLAVDVPNPAEGGDTTLGYASLDAVMPFPEGYGEAIAKLYTDMILAEIGGEPYTWGDLLAAYAFDMESDTASVNVQDLKVVAVPDALSFALANATLQLPSAITSKPFTYEQDLRLNWSGLTSDAAQDQVQAYVDALLPYEGLATLTASASLSDKARKRLSLIPLEDSDYDSVVQMQNTAKAFAEFDLSVDLTELNLLTSVMQLEGNGQASPDLRAVPEKITSWRDEVTDGLEISPNLDLSLMLKGLEAFEAIRQDMANADPGALGQLAWMIEMAASLTEPMDWLRSYVDTPEADPLTFELSLPTPEEATLNGRPLEF